MPLGYTLRTGDILAYYGMERKDIAETIFRYGRDRKVTMTTDPGTLGEGGGQSGFQSPDEILALAQKALAGDGKSIPRKHPSFHGTLARYSIDKSFNAKAQKGADVVIDIDIKDNYKEAFRNGWKVINFLDSYNIPYRIKFSGGSGPHIIIPYEAFPESISGSTFARAHQIIFHTIISRSQAGNIDGSFNSTSHFYRMPYSLNEHTGLVSLPLRKEQYSDFTPSMAEVWNVQVDEDWFQPPDKSGKEAITEMLRGVWKKKVREL